MITLATTATTTWAGTGRRVVVVVGGELNGSNLLDLGVVIRRAVADGAHRVVVDVSALVRGDHAALLGLAELRGEVPGWPGCMVDVTGLGWASFRVALLKQSPEDFQRLQTVFRELDRPASVVSLPLSTAARALVLRRETEGGVV